MNPTLKAALGYLERGLSVIPVDKDKTPLIEQWEQYQKRHATEDEVRRWWVNNPGANVAIVTGGISGLVVIEANTPGAKHFILNDIFPLSPIAIAGGIPGRQGYHFYMRHPRWHVQSITDSELGLNVRGDGGYAVAPPSVHESGNAYVWERGLGPEKIDPPELPARVLDYIAKHNGQPKPPPPCGSQEDTPAASNGQVDPQAADQPSPAVEVEPVVHKGAPAPDANQGQDDLVFPDVMTGLAGDFARLYASYLEVPPHFLFMSFLTCLGSVLADRLTLDSEIVPQPRLYVLLLGESADDKKSTAIERAVEFFEDAFPGVFSMCKGVGSAEGLIGRMGMNNKVVLFWDELKAFAKKTRGDTSVLLPCVNSLFESNRYENATKKLTLKIDNAYLSLLAASTVETFEQCWDSAFTDIGFDNRLFLIPGHGEKKYGIPPKVPDAEKSKMQARLQGLVEHVGKNTELPIIDSARAAYEAWYMGLERSKHTKRLDAYALRLMLLLAVNEAKRAIDADVVNKAIALVEWQLRIRQAYEPINADNAWAKMEEKIRRKLAQGGKLPWRDLWNFTNAKRAGHGIFDRALSNLIEAGEVTEEVLGKNRKRYALVREA